MRDMAEIPAVAKLKLTTGSMVEYIMYKTIVAPVDISEVPMSERILAKALFHLQYSDCIVHLLAIAPESTGAEQTDELSIALMGFVAEHIAAHAGKEDHVKLVVKKGAPADQILAYSREVNADLIILGRHRTAGSQLGRPALGSTTVKVSSQAEADISIIKKVE
ncbi:nucleotide-binding universal stress UspA family protein [Reinekea marinisedimentorum]|uniref:Nucleotide-binding universal stress UspA family protein n=2 Tax=Reinekea marinisedimentorum TaxID=230495 RepID=A0A4R3I3G5_9GAMM|nr:nucleotide-binding universal stress UspA family protein [Reinekea marinisedimentorum]